MSILDRDRTIAPPGYNRWLVPPAALAVHLSIGQVYAYSVLKDALRERFGIAPREGFRKDPLPTVLATPAPTAMTIGSSSCR